MKSIFRMFLAAGMGLSLAACTDAPRRPKTPHHIQTTAHAQARPVPAKSAAQDSDDDIKCYITGGWDKNNKRILVPDRDATKEERAILNTARQYVLHEKWEDAVDQYAALFETCGPDAAMGIEGMTSAINSGGANCVKARSELQNALRTWHLEETDTGDIIGLIDNSMKICPPAKKKTTGEPKCGADCLKEAYKACLQGDSVACDTACAGNIEAACKHSP